MNINPSGAPEAPELTESGKTLLDIRHLSTAEFQALGVSRVAYIKPATVDGVAAFSIHAADGTPMAVAGSIDVAASAILQHEMVPALVH
ncbi:MAG TPA: DUF1150 family protein [Acetobacteraceae bacterium]|nr:DUF1150 family protein [Acetobacteraceae bacterium]